MNKKSSKVAKELIEAARVAMADPDSDEFWADFANRERIQAEHAAHLVEKRPLTEDEKNSTK